LGKEAQKSENIKLDVWVRNRIKQAIKAEWEKITRNTTKEDKNYLTHLMKK